MFLSVDNIKMSQSRRTFLADKDRFKGVDDSASNSASTFQHKPVTALLNKTSAVVMQPLKQFGLYLLWILFLIGYIVFAIQYGNSLKTKDARRQFVYISILIVWFMVAGGTYLQTRKYTGVIAVASITLLYGILFSYGYDHNYGMDSEFMSYWVTVSMSVGMLLVLLVSFGYAQWRLGQSVQTTMKESEKSVGQRWLDATPFIKRMLVMFVLVCVLVALMVYSILALDGNAFVATSVQYGILGLIGAGAVYFAHKAFGGKDNKDKEWKIKGLISLFGLAVFATLGFVTGRTGGIITSGLAGLFLFVTGVMSYRKITEFKSWIELVYDMILFIPCLLFDGLFEVYKQWRITPSYVYFILLVEALLVGAYFGIPYLIRWVQSKDGVHLLEKPVYIDKRQTFQTPALKKAIQKVLAKEPRSPTDKTAERAQLYKYGISSWVYIDAQGANERESTSRYATVWDFGMKPLIEYNVRTQSIRVRVETHQGMEVVYDSADRNATKGLTKLPVKASQVKVAQGNHVRAFPLQRWNHVVVNMDGGTVTVWINGEMVGSRENVIPKKVAETFKVGEQHGIEGGVKDVRFYPHVLSPDTIWRLSWM